MRTRYTILFSALLVTIPILALGAEWPNIVIILVGLPLALMTGRRKAQTFVALGLAIGIGFFYYLVFCIQVKAI